MAQISYTNKVALNENPEIADINKVTDDDMNEIKQVVNDNYNNTIVISDTQPTSEDNKIWIDTGEVQNLGSEVHIGDTIDSKVGLNILFSEKYNKAQVEIGKSWQGATNTKRMRFVVPITPNKDYSILFKNNSTATINSYSIVETAEYPTTSSSPTMVVNVDEGVRNYYTSKSTTTYLTIQVDSNVDITQAIADSIFVSIWFKNPTINVDGEDIYSMPQVLWTNPNPTSSFAGQQITLSDSLENYDYYEVIYYNTTSLTQTFTSGKIKNDKITTLCYFAGLEANTYIAVRYRVITSVNASQGKITFGDAYNKYIHEQTLTTNNILVIPYKIIGYKE